MKRFLSTLLAVVAVVAAMAQTLNVEVGSVTYQIPAAEAGEMVYADGVTVTILNKVYDLSEVSRMYVDQSEVEAATVSVAYDGEAATVKMHGAIARYITPAVNGAHVTLLQSNEVGDDTCGEITYSLAGSSTNGSFTLEGSYKATLELRGLTLTNPTGAALNIQDGKKVTISVKNGTENTLTDGADGSQKACLYVKGHAEFKGKGTLNVYGKAGHGIFAKEYMEMKNCTINVLEAAKDGVNCNQYFLQESGALTISGVGDDGIQVSYKDETDREAEDTGAFTLVDGTLTITATADAAKGIKADGDISIQGGTLTVTQTEGKILVDGSDISYPTSVKSDGNIAITGGTVNITNTAAGGKGLSAEGTLTIDESTATTVIDIKANGTGGTAETTGGGSGDDDEASYMLYISLTTSGGMGPGGGGSSSWTNPVLYTSDGTKVAALTKTVTKSSGYQTVTFYYYDFKDTDSSLTYYIQADARTSGRGGTYTPRTATFSAPTSGSDIYYSVSNSYQTSGSTRIYSLTNVTNTYGGGTDVSEDNGTAYNAIGIKADKDITINGGTITVANSGSMSKSIKSKKNVTIGGGNFTLKPSGAMQVISGDANYSSGIKCDDFTLNDGSLSITASGAASRGISADNIVTNGGILTVTGTGAGQQGSSDTYTSKGLKADESIALNAGTITITMSGTGGKGIKSAGTYTQGTADGNGPTLIVSTSGSSLGGSGGGGWGGQQSGGSSAKAIKVQGKATLYGGTTEVSTKTNGAEGLESKTTIDIQGGKHYFFCYDDCINCSGAIYFNGGATVCYSNGNDAVDSNYGRSGAITIGNGAVFAYTSKGSPEEGLDCDNNSYIQITGTGIGISAGGSQGGGGGWGGSSSGNTISGVKQGYAFITSSLSYSTGRYYTLADASGNNLVTYSFQAAVSSTLALITAKGMTSGSSYTIKYSTTAPTDATTAWHGLYIGSSATGTNSFTSFTAK
ncbi:MAG: carbohydrate-binding domain-containing protein [Bacteroidaceae bacterium]|nr:carbohydrate-binding domain-containing protein [Bacteroidaceae bacterium]